MSSIETELEVLYKIGNATVLEYPYPHLYVPDVFPADFYPQLLAHLPPQGALKTLGQLDRLTGGDYPERGVLPLTAQALAALEPAQREFWERLRGFHGVEPIAEPEVRRDLLLYDIRARGAQQQPEKFTFS